MNRLQYLVAQRRQIRRHKAEMKALVERGEQQMRDFCEAQDRAMLRIVEAGLDDEEKDAIRAAVKERDAAMQLALANVQEIGRRHQKLNSYSTWLCWGMFWLSGFLFRGLFQ